MPEMQGSPFFTTALRYTGSVGFYSLERPRMPSGSVCETPPRRLQSHIPGPSRKHNPTMPSQLPLFPLGTVLFPGMPLPLRIFERRYLKMLADRREFDPAFGVVLIRGGREVGDIPQVSAIGTTASLDSLESRPDGTLEIGVIGRERFGIDFVDWSGDYPVATISEISSTDASTTESEPLLAETGAMFNRFVGGVAALYDRRFSTWVKPEDASSAVYDLASRLPLHTWERQAILDNRDTASQLREVNRLVRRELALLRAGTGGRVVNHPGGLFTVN